jgi:hypothetical protein
MYMQEGLVCSRDVPWVTQEEQGFGPLHPEVLRVSTYPPLPIYPGCWGPGWTGSYHTKEGFQVS